MPRPERPAPEWRASIIPPAASALKSPSKAWSCSQAARSVPLWTISARGGASLVSVDLRGR
jgi:hypothetical protein